MNTEATDIVVVGSGGAGLIAALAARAAGAAEVVVLERSSFLGGTTAVSGGMLWVPNNHHMVDSDMSDSAEEALAYLSRLTMGQVDEPLITTFVEMAPVMLRFLESQAAVRLVPVMRPDYHPDWPGGKPGGRSLDNEPFDTSVLGPLAAHLRKGPHFPPITYGERKQWGSPENFDWGLIAERIERRIVTLGGALVGGLLKGCLDHNVSFRLNARVRRLILDGETVAGVETEDTGGHRASLLARHAVILATGGFEWNPAMKRAFLRGPEEGPVSPPWNEGDGILMGMEVGAALANMGEAWWVPVIQIPGEEYDGRPLFRHLVDERCRPGAILVNRLGRRFVNEAANYNDMGKAFHFFDTSTYSFVNNPAFLVFDHHYKERYPILAVTPKDPVPPWIARADSLEGLARVLGIQPEGLVETAAHFSRHANNGHDPLFGRGETANDRYYGDPSHHPNPCLAPLEVPPFYGLRVAVGSLGTKGGLLTDSRGAVCHVSGRTIRGLYACGNVMASAMGPGYPGAGGTLGPGLTFGYLAGRAAAESRR